MQNLDQMLSAEKQAVLLLSFVVMTVAALAHFSHKDRQAMSQHIIEPQIYYSDWISDMKPLKDWSEVAGSNDEILLWIKHVFEYEGLPGELAWLAAVESGFNPRAVSDKGAVGLFQLMPDTARKYGLRVRNPDERYDPLRNAQAAARFLKSLYMRFGDWSIVFAAYNAGENRVARLVRIRGAEFDAIANYLPSETRSFVPRVKALIEYHGKSSVDEVRAPFLRYGGVLVASDRVP